MAAPTSKTVKDLSGKWIMNKTLSDDPDPALALQGIGWMTRKVIGMASITLDVKEYEAPPSPPSESDAAVTHILIEQTGTAGLKGTTEKRCLDDTFREHSDWLFGHVKGRSAFLAPADLPGPAFLAEGWLEDEAERTGPAGESHILSHVESLDNGWTATQIWGFQTVEGERRYCRKIVVAKDGQEVKFRLVYDYIS